MKVLRHRHHVPIKLDDVLSVKPELHYACNGCGISFSLIGDGFMEWWFDDNSKDERDRVFKEVESIVESNNEYIDLELKQVEADEPINMAYESICYNGAGLYPLNSKWQNPDNGFIFEVLKHLEDRVMLFNETVGKGVTYDLEKMKGLVRIDGDTD